MHFETAQGIIKLLFHSLIILWLTPGIVQKIYHMLNTGTLDIEFAILRIYRDITETADRKEY